MKSLKVIFFGTPEFAKTSLEAIHKSHHEVVGVVTVADKASGRGQKINQSAVKIFAEENNLPVFQPEKLKNHEFLEEIQKLNADVFVVVAFRMMPKILFEMPEIEALAAGMKAYSTWSTTAILQECREACGGKGYLSENRIDALKNDTEVYTTFEGDNTVLMQLVAKNRLSEFRKSFGQMEIIEKIKIKNIVLLLRY